MYILINIERERGKGYTVRCKEVSQKSNLCICSGALWLIAKAIHCLLKACGDHDGIEHSQTYDEVNKASTNTCHSVVVICNFFLFMVMLKEFYKSCSY